tara:strand:- start:373 stop:1029 length:657 start_codon:yes stop_codon:yes gene_type:complete
MPFDAVITTSIFEAPKKIITGFLDEEISADELFLHSYRPKFEPYVVFSANQVEEPIFSILKNNIEELDGDTKQEFQSISSVGDIVNTETPTEEQLYGVDTFVPLYFLEYSPQELEGILYARPVELQLSIVEEELTSERSYVNLIPKKEIEFSMLSSLGSIVDEEIVLDGTTTGAESSLSSTTEVITDVGGPTATGTRSFTTYSDGGEPITGTATIRRY